MRTPHRRPRYLQRRYRRPRTGRSPGRCGDNPEWVRQPKIADLVEGEILMHIRSIGRVPLRETVIAELPRLLQLRRSALDKYLIELIEKDAWIEGIRYLVMGKPLMPRQPWPYYKDEQHVWV
jgi:hypothetical protein